MKTLIHNATVVQNFERNEIQYQCSILINEDGIIEEIGDSTGFADRKNDFDIIPMDSKVIMPGFINCHTHLTATLGRGINEDVGFPPILPYSQLFQYSHLSDEELSLIHI